MSEEIIVDLNIGGSYYTTSRQTILSTINPNNLFHDLLETKSKPIVHDSNQRIFIDRNGSLFKFVLDYLRNEGRLVLPDNFDELDRLKLEAQYYKMNHLEKLIDEQIQTNRSNRKQSILTTDENDDYIDSATVPVGGGGGSGLTTNTMASLDVHRNSTKASFSMMPPLLASKNWSKNYSGCIVVG